MATSGRLGRYLRYFLAILSYRLPFQKLVTTRWLNRMVGDSRAIVVGHGIDLSIFKPLDGAREAGEEVVDHQRCSRMASVDELSTRGATSSSRNRKYRST